MILKMINDKYIIIDIIDLGDELGNNYVLKHLITHKITTLHQNQITKGEIII